MGMGVAMNRRRFRRSTTMSVVVALATAIMLLAAQTANASPFRAVLAQAWGLHTDSSYTGGTSGDQNYAYEDAIRYSPTGPEANFVSGFSGSTASFSLTTGQLEGWALTPDPGRAYALGRVDNFDMVIGTPQPPCGDLVTCILWALFPPAPTSVRIQADRMVSTADVSCDSATTGRQAVSTTYTNLRINGQTVTPSSAPNVTSHQFGYTIIFNKDDSSQTIVGGHLRNVAFRTGLWVQRDGSSSAVELTKAFAYESC